MTLRYGYEKNETGITLTDLYDSAVGNIEVPGEWQGKTVTAIGEALFKGQTGLTGITLPATVTELGWWSLRECTALTEVLLPPRLQTIGYRAFSGCTALREIKIPDSVTHIGEAAFWGCTALKRMTLPPDLKVLHNRTFYGCSHLTDLILPPRLESIEWGAFEYCKGLRALTVPATVTKIGSNALRECSGLRELNLADGTEAISENLFGHRNLPPLERGYIPHTDPALWEEEAGLILCLCYLTTAELHAPAEREQYEAFIREHQTAVLTRAVKTAAVGALEGLYAMGLPELCDYPRYLELANAQRTREAVASLLAYGHRIQRDCTPKQQLQRDFDWEEL